MTLLQCRFAFNHCRYSVQKQKQHCAAFFSSCLWSSLSAPHSLFPPLLLHRPLCHHQHYHSLPPPNTISSSSDSTFSTPPRSARIHMLLLPKSLDDDDEVNNNNNTSADHDVFQTPPEFEQIRKVLVFIWVLLICSVRLIASVRFISFVRRKSEPPSFNDIFWFSFGSEFLRKRNHSANRR